MIKLFSQLESALQEDEPIEAIRELAIKLHASGTSKQEILKEFNAFDEMLKNANRNQDSDYLEDVLDMMSESYVGRNLDFG